MENLLEKLNKKEAKIGIYGLGYVGLPLALTFSESGYKVVGFDIDLKKIETLNNGISYINHISDTRILNAKNKHKIKVTTDFSITSDVEALILCVPTPLNKYREPDLSFIQRTISSIKPYLRKGQIIVLESTTYPGTTDEEIKPIIESEGFEVGKDIFLAYSPEREDPGNVDYTTNSIPKVLGGVTKNCTKVGVALYDQVINELIVVSNTRTAEMTKLLENIHRSVNIGLMNELKPLAEKMGIDLYEVINAASSKPFGFTPYYPGPGLGGHCIPIDPFYLTWKAREFGMNTRFIELAGEINKSMPRYVLEKTVNVLNSVGKALNGSRILILGIAYKKNIDDTRESPSVEILKLLHDQGSIVQYSDPFFENFPKMRDYQFNLQSVELNDKNLSRFDLVILATDHDSFDYQTIKNASKFIIDTRGKFNLSEKIFRA
ncbi:nucleotide sugar dehydrogenase [Prochlorococcus sp. AH-716-B04]|nr:nucleotide sugar dehydrogenase [Prochlorococcus sp. AH-716-B04]